MAVTGLTKGRSGELSESGGLETDQTRNLSEGRGTPFSPVLHARLQPRSCDFLIVCHTCIASLTLHNNL